ncbi:MAG: hypothetical protein IKW77_10565 [Salinivirgaceae bacterium]|nr:hypothetical protein [Salinivirgaceae bacterium]
MKKSFLLMGALCVGTAFVSCVDDSESNEVKELRQVQLDSKKADLDNQYWTMYNNAVTKVKTYRDDLKTAQENLDAAKDEKTTLTEVKDAYIAYQQMVIARNEKDIADKKAEIEVQKAMAGKSYEDIQKAKITSANDAEAAAKAAQDYWIDLTNKGYNQSYDKYDTDGDPDTEMTADIDDATDMLLGDYAGSLDVKYRNNKLSENAWVKAMNAIYSYEPYSYQKANGLYETVDDYDFYLTDDVDPTDDPGSGTYVATSMLQSRTIDLQDANGYAYQSYTKYSFKDVDKYTKALADLVQQKKEAIPTDKTDPSYEGLYNDWSQYNALKTKISGLVTILTEQYESYETLLNTLVDYATEIRKLIVKYDNADAIATAYSTYSVTNNESTVASLEDAIKTYNEAIKTAKAQINETINNGLTDKETAIAYYNARIAEINSAIAANQAIAEKYRALIAGSSSSNNQQQQQTPAPEETPAE